MGLVHEFSRDPDDYEFVCVRCGHPFTEIDLGAHIEGCITDRKFQRIAIDGDICKPCLECMWVFSNDGLDGAKRRLNLSINLTHQAMNGKYIPTSSNGEYHGSV